MLEDIEASSKFLLTNTSNNEQLRRRFITNVNQRLHITEASFKSRESILNLRRILLLLLPDKQKLIPEQDKGWLITTKIARKYVSDVFKTQSKIYGGAFLAKIVNGYK